MQNHVQVILFGNVWTIVYISLSQCIHQIACSHRFEFFSCSCSISILTDIIFLLNSFSKSSLLFSYIFYYEPLWLSSNVNSGSSGISSKLPTILFGILFFSFVFDLERVVDLSAIISPLLTLKNFLRTLYLTMIL